jgi:hypothetical protein
MGVRFGNENSSFIYLLRGGYISIENVTQPYQAWLHWFRYYLRQQSAATLSLLHHGIGGPLYGTKLQKIQSILAYFENVWLLPMPSLGRIMYRPVTVQPFMISFFHRINMVSHALRLENNVISYVPLPNRNTIDQGLYRNIRGIIVDLPTIPTHSANPFIQPMQQQPMQQQPMQQQSMNLVYQQPSGFERIDTSPMRSIFTSLQRIPTPPPVVEVARNSSVLSPEGPFGIFKPIRICYREVVADVKMSMEDSASNEQGVVNEGDAEVPVCGICFSDNPYIVTDCGHSFCSCITNNMLKYDKKGCPTCRQTISELFVEDRRSFDTIKSVGHLFPSNYEFCDSSV